MVSGRFPHDRTFEQAGDSRLDNLTAIIDVNSRRISSRRAPHSGWPRLREPPSCRATRSVTRSPPGWRSARRWPRWAAPV